MGCCSPQLLLGPDPAGQVFTDCGICNGCVQVRAKLNRERQRAWFDRAKRRFHNG